MHIIKSKLNTELVQITKEIEITKKHLSSLPNGKIQFQHSGKYVKWIYSDNKQRKVIHKKDFPFAHKLAKKQYLLAQLQDLIFQQKLIQTHLLELTNYNSNADRVLHCEDFQKLISIKPPSINSSEANPLDEDNEIVSRNNSPNAYATSSSSDYATSSSITYNAISLINDSLSANAWMSQEFERNMSNPQNLKFKSISGNILRSKSEVFIDQALFSNNIPYRYECKLELGNTILYPDFTILHPSTFQLYYWEHFGMMDNPQYSSNAFKKMQLYNQMEIYPGINLIMSFETKENPFSYLKAENIIHDFFDI